MTEPRQTLRIQGFMRIRRFAFVASAVAAFALVSATARASLKAPPPPLEIAQTCDVAFVGKVESVGKDSMRVVVGEVLKGAPTGVVTVGPIFYPQCMPDARDVTPAYKAGDVVLIEAKATKVGYETVGGAWCAEPIRDAAGLAHAVAFVREMLRIAALPDADARRAAMITHMSSRDPSYVDAATWFQFDELKTPEQTRPHAAALVAALDAPLPRGRQAAMRALVGVAPSGAVARLVKLTASAERDDADCACAALAPLDDERAIDAILLASNRPDHGIWFLAHLGASPRKEARAKLRDLLRSGDAEARKVALRGYETRIRTFGADEDDVDDLLAVAREESRAADDVYAMSNPMVEARSSRLAAGMLELVRDAGTSASRRAVAYRVLHEYATKAKMTDVVELLRKNEALFIRRLDEPGGDAQMHLHWLLGVIRTPACKACLERAMKRQDTPTSHGDAWRTLYDWKD